MLSNKSPQAIAIHLNGQNYTYEQLHSMIALEKKKDNQLEWLCGSYTIDFIVKFLAALKSNSKILVYSEKTSTEDLALVKKNIEENGLHPECKLILLTSGSSGIPKAVQLSLANILANTEAVVESLNFNEISSQVLFLPLSYSFGLLGQLLPALTLGKTTYLADHLVKVKNLIDTKDIEMISGVPSHLSALLKILNTDKCKKVTHVISAGAPLEISLRIQLVDFFKAATIYNNYGQTELSPRALSLSSKHPDFFKGAVGKVVKGLNVKISTENELLFSGKQVMLGYVNSDQNKIQNGWLHTQDLASEKNGIIYINGRMDDQIKVGGEKINISFIEDLLFKVPGLKDDSIKFKVFSYLDPLYGQQVALAYVGTISEEDFKKNYLVQVLEKYRPKKIKKIMSFPLNENGKIDVVKMRTLI